MTPSPLSGTVSLCMIVRDEAETLARCLESARPYVHEMIIVDTGSTDSTREIAKGFGAAVFQIPWENDFSKARNVALDKATSDWILGLDADEVLSVQSPREFSACLRDGSRAGFLLRLDDLRDNAPPVSTLLLRMFRNHPDVRYRGLLHERVDESLDRLAQTNSWTLERLPASIEHCGYLRERVRSRGKNDRNRDLLERARRSSENDPYLLYKTAVHPLNYPDRPEAVRDCLERAWSILHRLDPPSCRRYVFAPEVPALLAIELSRSGERDAALALTELGLEHCGESPNLHFVRARLQQSLGQHDEAIDHFDRALRYRDQVLAYAPLEGVTSYRSYAGKSECLMVLGKDAAARTCFDPGTEGVDDACHAFFTPVEALVASGEAERALRLLLARVTSIPSDQTTWERGRKLLLALGREDAAHAWSLKAAVQIKRSSEAR